MWDEIINPFPNFNVATEMDKEFHLTFYKAYDYLSMLGLKLVWMANYCIDA